MKRETTGESFSPNCLQVLLISDPETDKAAASMAVRVGSDSDPDGLEGLAHFLEHMLFYASERLSVIRETGFHYRDKSLPISYVVGVTSNMLFYSPRDWLVVSSLPSNFIPDTIQMILNELTPDNVRIFWDSKKFDGHTDMVEPWYRVVYVAVFDDVLLNRVKLVACCFMDLVL